MDQLKLFMMLGYPGAGKTTTAEIVANLTGSIHLASDQMRLQMFPKPTFTTEEHQKLYQTLNQRTKELLTHGKSVVYDANLNRYQHRAEKYQLCLECGAKPILLWVRTSKNVSKNRAVHHSRFHLWPHDEEADKMFDRLVSVFETPHAGEPYIELDGTKITQSYVLEQLQKAGIL